MFSSKGYFYLAKDARSAKFRSFSKELVAMTASLFIFLSVDFCSFSLIETGNAMAAGPAKAVLPDPAKEVPPASREALPDNSEESNQNNTPSGNSVRNDQLIEALILQLYSPTEQSKKRGSQEEHASGATVLFRPSIRPVSGYITSGFGLRLHPVYNRIMFHYGTDFSASEGSDVVATADGVISFSGYDGGYGKKIMIDHGNGYQTVYAHLSRTWLRQGQRVRQGNVIALSGNTGVSTSPHLHYEVLKDRVHVNPLAYIPDDTNKNRYLTLKQPSMETEDSNF